MAFLLTYFCSTGSRRKTASFLSCLMPRVCPAHKPLQANISTRKMALDVYETQEGTHACTCCRRTTRTSTRRGHHRPRARASREVGPPRSTARIKRRSTHRRDGLAEISSKTAGIQRRGCSLSSNQTGSGALFCDPTTSAKNTSASPDGAPAGFRMVLSTGPGEACGLRS